MTRVKGIAGQSLRHESAIKQVMGRADYTDDIVMPEGALHAYLGLSQIAAGRIVAMDLGAVEAAPGLWAWLTAKDVPGSMMSADRRHDEPVSRPIGSNFMVRRCLPWSPQAAMRRAGRRNWHRSIMRPRPMSRTWPRHWRRAIRM